MTRKTEMSALRIGGPANISRHTGDGQSVQNHRRQPGIFQFIYHIEPFCHIGLSIDDARVMSVVVEMDVVIVVIFKPAAVQVQTANGTNQDEKRHNVKHEVHKRQGSFPYINTRTALRVFRSFRGATMRRVKYSFGRMILLFSSEYKGVDDTFYRSPARICHRNRPYGVSYTGTLRAREERWR